LVFEGEFSFASLSLAGEKLNPSLWENFFFYPKSVTNVTRPLGSIPEALRLSTSIAPIENCVTNVTSQACD